ncbi:MAG: GPP34 family phosphoprotein [Clostridiales Family XIII bacterium]|jgi:hypothetical protein|nr:GPP34 family phosphoprotein [Clostridiales Family XIII bacterium]
MKALSFTQEYFLCAINENGNLPVLDSEISVCLLAGGIMELTRQGYIGHDEKKRFAAAKPWDDTLPYLKPLYDTVAAFKKPQKIDGIVGAYETSLKKPFPELLSALGTSLVAAGYADEQGVRGLLKDKPGYVRYVPKPEAVTHIIEKIRAEFLENGVISDETLCLTALLDGSRLIRRYFSKVERDTLKKRLKEVRESEAYASIREFVDASDGAMAAAIVVAD